MAGKIFINYRREDSIATAGRIHDRLAKALGRGRLFMDVDHIPAGVDFVSYLERQVAQCDLLLAVIGPSWLNAIGPDGKRRIDNPEDFVVIEIAAALARDIRVIPVLIDNAKMPRADELPEILKQLARRNAITLQNSQFGSDAERLVEKVREALKGEPAPQKPKPWGKIATGAAVLTAGVVAVFIAQSGLMDDQGPAEERGKAAVSTASTTKQPIKTATPEKPVESEKLARLEQPLPTPEPAPTSRPVAASEWISQTGNDAGHRYSSLAQINRSNVSKLHVAWQFSTGVLRGHEGGPLVADGVMYVHTPWPNIVYALDLADEGSVIWKYEPRQDPSTIPVMCCDTVNRGLALGTNGSIYLHQADTTIVSLDRKTGKERWKAVNGDPKKGEIGTSAPLFVKDKVIVGVSGGEFGVRGHVTALDAASGKREWRAYSVGPDADILFDPRETMSLGKPVGRDSSLKTWTGDQWKIGGGTTWGWLTYDADLDLVYYGSANPSTWNPKQRAGPDGKPIDQKWTNSIFARNPDTGVAAWAYQMTPFDEWSFDGVGEMILADIAVAGRQRKALVHFDKNGLAYTLDRQTGELLVAKKFETSVNWTSGVEMDKTRPTYGRPQVVDRYSTFLNGPDVNTKDICPASIGAKNQQPAAFSPGSETFFIPTTRVCMDYEPFKVSYTAGQPYVGVTISMYPAPGAESRGAITAWDAGEGKQVWSKPEKFPVWSGVLATAGDVVFYGTMEGHLKALDAKTGKELFKYKTSSGIIGNVMTYAFGGKQYIAVLSGVGGWAGIGLAAGLTNPTDGLGAVGLMADLKKHTSLGGQVLVFALP